MPGSGCGVSRSEVRARRAFGRAAAVSALVVGAAMAWASPASAQSKEELNRARQEFQEGVALAAANNCAAAIGKFRSVLQVKATAQVSFNIAECEERMGRLAAAVGDYRVAAKTAEGDPKAKDVYAKCGDKIAAIEPRVPKLTISRGNGADSATIELDGVELGTSQLGTEIPVDPGPHVVVGKVGDKVYFRQNVTLEEKETKPIDVVMKVSNAPIAVDEQKPENKTEEPPEKPRSRVPGIVMASAGAVSVGVGVAFFAMSQSQISTLNKICGQGSTSCPPSQAAKDAASSGKTDMGLAEVTIGLGTVAVVAGIVLAATAGPKKKPAADAPPSALFSPAKRVFFVAAAPGASAFGGSFMGSF
jgi:hypothetical protein